MIKFIQCVRRKPSISVAEFRRSWEAYREKVQALAQSSQAVRFAMSTTLQVEENITIMMSRGTDQPYDGLVEIWWSKGPDALEILNTPETQAQIEAIRRLQEEFMDLGKSSFFFGAEEVYLERDAKR
jgi:hypothetical protein